MASTWRSMLILKRNINCRASCSLQFYVGRYIACHLSTRAQGNRNSHLRRRRLRVPFPSRKHINSVSVFVCNQVMATFFFFFFKNFYAENRMIYNLWCSHIISFLCQKYKISMDPRVKTNGQTPLNWLYIFLKSMY